jgi:hypothetical protein
MRRIIIILISLIVFYSLWNFGTLSQQTQVKQGTSTMEGIIVIKHSVIFLVADTNFTSQNAEVLSISEIIGSYQSVYQLNGINSSLRHIKNGDTVKIWYSEILESFPAKIKVSKIMKQ